MDLAGMTATERRQAAYEAAVQAPIATAPPISAPERERLSRAWRASGSALVFEEPGRQAA
jgi:hypothetical protein